MSDQKQDLDHPLKHSTESPLSLCITLFLAMRKELRAFVVMEEDFTKRGISLRPTTTFTSKQLENLKDSEITQLIDYFHNHHIKARSADRLWSSRAYQLSDEIAKRRKESREL